MTESVLSFERERGTRGGDLPLDAPREVKEEFFDYPEFYMFQPTAHPVDYRMFDFYSDPKNGK